MAPKTLQVTVSLEPIPQDDGADWQAFCREYDIYPLGSGRRGWWKDMGTYVRGAKYVMLLEGKPIDLYDEEPPEEAP